MLELLGRLARAPTRRGGILDIPFEEYAEEVTSAPVVEILEAYARLHTKPTLRAVLADERFRRWLAVSRPSPVRKKLEEELAFVGDIVEEEYILDDEDEKPTRPRPTLREWAERAGVVQRLNDPAAALASLTNGNAAYVLRSARSETVEDVFEGRLEGVRTLTPSLRSSVVALAERYVREAGERVLADLTRRGSGLQRSLTCLKEKGPVRWSLRSTPRLRRPRGHSTLT